MCKFIKTPPIQLLNSAVAFFKTLSFPQAHPRHPCGSVRQTLRMDPSRRHVLDLTCERKRAGDYIKKNWAARLSSIDGQSLVFHPIFRICLKQPGCGLLTLQQNGLSQAKATTSPVWGDDLQQETKKKWPLLCIPIRGSFAPATQLISWKMSLSMLFLWGSRQWAYRSICRGMRSGIYILKR